jgi:hypothetical protein
MGCLSILLLFIAVIFAIYLIVQLRYPYWSPIDAIQRIWEKFKRKL